MVYAMFIFTMSRTRCLLLGMPYNFPPQSISAHQMTMMALNLCACVLACRCVYKSNGIRCYTLPTVNQFIHSISLTVKI